MRLPIAALAAFVLSLALAAPASASAKQQPLPDPADFSFIATIDCGRGPVQVGSTDDIYAPLVDLATGRSHEPVAWDVSVGDFHFVDRKEGATLRNSHDCSYVDEWVSGTVTVKGRSRGDHGGDRHKRWSHRRRG